ncbi:DNA mismatch repair protein PMS1 [Plasmodium gonderi]|uniref:DNA mismatch repair protein PMS1 n=1 Tax=Plasmodium gonderi TaxID=77519 RepID=A0A1Y1JD52_PLAGO|nr:DNA mismatch repair protein PMS1 [Plasmodium gonderi]GAW79147.1 DNA mismatch repair protein PMS1 [Plasmodium gonderi]
MNIQSIGEESIHNICSSQVIFTLSSVVKELVENSIDAEASEIKIKLVENGIKLIEVNDNGAGIRKANFENVCARHATSKISEFEDIHSTLNTLGFRGEALNSLCMLSDLHIVTKHDESTHGYLLKFDKLGRLNQEEPIARLRGTTVSCENIFKNIPIRKKDFIKNIKSQLSDLLLLMQQYAIIYCHIKFIIHNIVTIKGTVKNMNMLITNGGNESVKKSIYTIYGKRNIGNLIEFNIDNEEWKVRAYISDNNSGRRDKDIQFYYINSRPIHVLKSVNKIINSIYREFNSRMYPIVICNILSDIKNFDINVTPDKREVFFIFENELCEHIKTSLVRLLTPQTSALIDTHIGDYFLKANNIQPQKLRVKDELANCQGHTYETADRSGETANHTYETAECSGEIASHTCGTARHDTCFGCTEKDILLARPTRDTYHDIYSPGETSEVVIKNEENAHTQVDPTREMGTKHQRNSDKDNSNNNNNSSGEINKDSNRNMDHASRESMIMWNSQNESDKIAYRNEEDFPSQKSENMKQEEKEKCPKYLHSSVNGHVKKEYNKGGTPNAPFYENKHNSNTFVVNEMEVSSIHHSNRRTQQGNQIQEGLWKNGTVQEEDICPYVSTGISCNDDDANVNEYQMEEEANSYAQVYEYKMEEDANSYAQVYEYKMEEDANSYAHAYEYKMEEDANSYAQVYEYKMEEETNSYAHAYEYKMDNSSNSDLHKHEEIKGDNNHHCDAAYGNSRDLVTLDAQPEKEHGRISNRENANSSEYSFEDLKENIKNSCIKSIPIDINMYINREQMKNGFDYDQIHVINLTNSEKIKNIIFQKKKEQEKVNNYLCLTDEQQVNEYSGLFNSSLNIKEGNSTGGDVITGTGTRTGTGNDEDINFSNIDEKQKDLYFNSNLFEKLKICGQFNKGFVISKIDLLYFRNECTDKKCENTADVGSITVGPRAGTVGPDEISNENKQENNYALFIIDQHAADEKSNFEKYNKIFTMKSQKLISKIDLELSPAQIYVIEKNFEIFLQNGFDIEIVEEPVLKRRKISQSFEMDTNYAIQEGEVGEKGAVGDVGEKGAVGSVGEKGVVGSVGEKGEDGDDTLMQVKVYLLSLPVFNGKMLEVEDFMSLLHHLTEHPITYDKESFQMFIKNKGQTNRTTDTWFNYNFPRPQKVWRILASKACRNAIMVGKTLNVAEMIKIKKKLSVLKNPWNCPHGRPTIKYIINDMDIKICFKNYYIKLYDEITNLILTKNYDAYKYLFHNHVFFLIMSSKPLLGPLLKFQ